MTAHEKTWLDECATFAMSAIIGDTFSIDSPKDTAKISYDFAEAMLAEKLKRENKKE